jgi:hypothetical protein
MYIHYLKKKPPKKGVTMIVTLMFLLTNVLVFSMISLNSPRKQMIEKYDDEDIKISEPQNEYFKEGNGDHSNNFSHFKRTTRAINPYISRAIHPIHALDNDGGNTDYLNLDEDIPGDNNKESTGKDTSYAWIECQYGSSNIPVGSTIYSMSVYIGYHCDADWDIANGHNGIAWSPIDGSSEYNISDYPVSITDRDEIFTITSDLPTVSELNSGIKIRISGYDTDGAGPDYLFLDYLYFTLNYSIPKIVINEIMFNATANDDNAEWIELYNAGKSPVDLNGWNLTDNDGNRFSLTDAGSVPAGGYLICHLAQSGTSNSTHIFGTITTHIIFQPGVTEGIDTYFGLNSPTSNYGTDPFTRVENSADVFRSLMQFNLSEISENGLSVSKLYLYHYDGHSSGNAIINVHRLNHSWTESSSDWNTSDGTNNWTTAGGDYNSTIENTSLVIAGSYGWYSWDITDLTRCWKNGTYENYGLILLGNAVSSWHLFYSSDYLGDTSMRPKLVIEYNNTHKMLDDIDDLALVDNYGNIVDYVAWGEDPGLDDEAAVLANQWFDGEYIDTSQLLEGQTLGRDREGNDTDRKEDWLNATGYSDDFGVDRGDFWGPSPGESNADPDLKGPRIRDVFAHPETEVLGGYINITCKVTDPDGVYNVWLNITMPNGEYFNASMIQYSDILWYYNDNPPSLGQYQYTIWANDAMGNWSVGDVRQFEIVNRAPSLSSGQVNPSVGYFTSWFNFTVTYTDLDNHAPDIITVNITNLGLFSLMQLDNADTVFADGKIYYINISTIPAGISYTFHFAANDTMGLWGNETLETDAPDILPKSAMLTAYNETTKYSNDAYLTAVLMENSTPIEGENIAFYIDINDNEFYEAAELVGEGITLADGSVSFINRTYLAPGTYDVATVYVGSGNYHVNNGKALLIINAKKASLTAQNEVAEEGETTTLSAMLIDEDGNLIAEEQVAFFLDKNRNEIYEGSELIGLSLTSAMGIASIDYAVNLVPQEYKIWAKYTGSANYFVNETEGMLTVQNSGNNPPTILRLVPNQIKPEDSPPWTLSLTSYEADNEDYSSDLKWYITGVDTTLYSVTGLNSSDDLFTFIPVEDAFGNDEAILWLVDSSGALVSQILWINITPVNDVPYFDPVPPDLNIHYDDPTTDLDDPVPWDYRFYVQDVETPIENLVITSSEPSFDSGDGYVDVNDLKATFHYPHSRVGETIIVTLTLSDGTDSTQTIILINVTTNWAPELISQLPDITLEEGSTMYNVVDLDDYFTDRDDENMIFSFDSFHIKVNINGNNTVDITTSGQWTGSDSITFRAEDPTGAIAEGYTTVTVIPINNAPVISGVPDLVVHFDLIYAFDLSPYISDRDNLTSDLIVWTSEPTEHIWLQQNNNLGIVVSYPESMNTTAIPLWIHVSDGIEIASQQILIIVTNDFSPELLIDLPDVSFNEDSVLENAFILSDYFYDPDGDTLEYITFGESIIITINDNLTVDFSVPENWYGSEIITFRAIDPYGALAEDRISVIVVPVNDPTTLRSIPDQEKDEGDHWVLDLSQYIMDVDNNVSKLLINVDSEAGQDYVDLVGTILIFQYPRGVYEDVIKVTVSDGENETSWSFNVSLNKSVSVAPSIWDVVAWPWLLIALLVSLSGAFVIYRKKSDYHVYEAFLIHETGPALAYASREKNMELEDVIVSGMFTAVQDFINDTLSGRTFDDWELDEMKFSDGKILIEKSKNLYLAVIFEGNSNKVRNRVKKLLEDINREYGEVLEDWDDDMTKLKGIEEMTMNLISEKKAPLGEHVTHLENDGSGFLKDVKIGENEVYICPVCEMDINIEYAQCPRCGVRFEEIMDSPIPSQQKPKSNEFEGKPE